MRRSVVARGTLSSFLLLSISLFSFSTIYSGLSVYRCACKGLTFAAKVLDMAQRSPKRGPIPRLWRHGRNIKIGHVHGAVLGNTRGRCTWSCAAQRTLLKRGYLVQIAKGLHYLHSQEPPIVHRDLKEYKNFEDRCV
ncbi:serine threonine protein kinase [Balamuthia mandrillaris]